MADVDVETLTGSATPAGAVIPSLTVPLDGEVTPAGDATPAESTPQNAGSTTPSGSVSPRIIGSYDGTVAPSGIVRPVIIVPVIGSVAPAGFANSGIGEAPCNITVADFKTRLGKLLDDPGHVYYTESEILHVLNIAQRLFCFLTLAIERTVTFNLTNGQNFYRITDQLVDFIAPLRVSHAGRRLRSDTIHQMNLRDAAWRTRPGNPVRYAQHGLNKLWITPQPASGSHTLDFTYAAEPAELVNDTDVPEIPGDQQTVLEDFAFFFLRLKEGGAELQNAGQYLKRALDATQKYASFVRAKNRAQQYDRMPLDLESFDRSAFELKLTQQKAAMMKAKKDAQQ